MRHFLSLAIATSLPALLLACTSSPSAGSGGACVPGIVASCECPAGAGVRVCEPRRSFGACDCTQTDGVTPDPTGQADFLIDFGALAVGDRAHGTLPLRNLGNAPLQFQAEAVAAPFERETTGPVLLGPGQGGELRWGFRPTGEGTFSQVARVASSEGEVTVRLAGVAFEPSVSCEPASVDFGEVWRGQTLERDVVCTNTAAGSWLLNLGPVEGLDAVLFTARLVDSRPAEPGEGWTIRVTVQTGHVGLHSAALPLLGTGDRRIGTLYLGADARTSGLACGPSVVDFGFVGPGNVGRRQLVCVNDSPVPITITGLALDPSSSPRFSWEPPAPIVVPAGEGAAAGRVTIDLAFAPELHDAGSRINGMLDISTDEPSVPRLQVPLVGFAGGPMIACSPTQLDFGLVAKGLPATRSFVCTNVGTDDPSRADDGLVISDLRSTNPSEFTATPRGPLDPGGYGIGETFTVDVVYNPVDDGADVAELQVFSNATNSSVDAPYAVHLAGVGRALPPCDVEVAPERLRFGVVQRLQEAVLGFGIRNRMVDGECLVQDLRLGEGCDPAYSLPEGEIPFYVLGPGHELRVPVRFRPPAYRSTPFTCDVLFDVSNPSNPNQVVPVRGASQEPCLVAVPGELDFGATRVAATCRPVTRELELINICSQTLTLDRLEVTAAGGADEFVLTAPPAGTTIPPGLSVTATVAYAPQAEGDDLGGVLAYVQGVPEPYLATGLRGRGTSDPTRFDAFEVNDRPKADVLIVMDNSDGMAEEQAAFAANLRPFLSFAQAQEIDYHLGVTTSGLVAAGACPGGAQGGEAGRLFPVDNSRPRVITPNTPNMEMVWAANMRVGTCHYDEHVLEAAYLGLTPPVSDNCDDSRFPQPNDGNCGFLRDDAHLSIIAVTDEAEGSSQVASYYATAFQALKGVGKPHLFNFHAVTGDRGTGCSSTTGGAAAAGDTLISLAESTEGGIFRSICTADWATTLRDLSFAAFGYRTCFTLGQVAEDTNGNGQVTDTEAEIQVRLNGRVTPSVSPEGQTIWTYRPAQHAVCFEPLARPEPGTQVDVGYRMACVL